ncbi:MAG: 1,4-alpha-glucan branching enzyme [Anaerolineae bacterium]
MTLLLDLHPDGINAILYADHGAPFDILGPHPHPEGGVVIRALRPDAARMTLLVDKHNFPMEKVRNEGLFAVHVPTITLDTPYQLAMETGDGQQFQFDDPYRYRPLISDFDLHLFGEGQLNYAYRTFGAHIMTVDGVSGTRFAVWAPNARRISIVGSFNHWDGRIHPMRHIGGGVWELFIPGVGEGALYKYEVRSHHMGYQAQKNDPYGFFNEMRPSTASMVVDINRYTWNDADWLSKRAEGAILAKPIAIYEVHLGSWRRKPNGDWLTYRELAHELVGYVADMGYTHIELMPITEHPFDGSWGYQTTGYFAPTSRFGTPDDFKYLVDCCHQAGIGVILDWVPAHFPKDGWSLSYFDGTHLYEHADSRKGQHPDWGTLIFNYGRNEVRTFLISSALFWLKEYHIDGLRVDAVSSMLYLNFSRKEGEWIPNQYGGNENLEAVSLLRKVNELTHTEVPGSMMIAEESTAWAMVSRPTYIGGLGFTLKWDMGWMHDTLKYMEKDPVHRRYHHNMITFSMLYAFTENFVLSLSHDEVVHGKGSLIGKMSGDIWQKFANLRALFGYQYTHPGKKLNFMGQEFAQWREWSEARALDWELVRDWDTHRGMQNLTRDLNRLYKSQPALYEQDVDWAGFQWIDPNDADNSVYTYLRFAKNPDDFLVVAINFTPIPRYHYRVGVPKPGIYEELLNTDAGIYGGSNMGNMGAVNSESWSTHGQPHSISLTLPPLAVLIFKLKPTEPPTPPTSSSKTSG